MKINALICFYLCQILWYWCYYLNTLRYTLSPVCGIFRAISNHRVWFRVAMSHLDLSWFFLSHCWRIEKLCFVICALPVFFIFFLLFFLFSLDSFTKSLLFDLLGFFFEPPHAHEGPFSGPALWPTKKNIYFLEYFQGKSSIRLCWSLLYPVFCPSVPVPGDSCWIEEEKGWKCFTLET